MKRIAVYILDAVSGYCLPGAAKGPQGWLSRDPHNDDWILWDEQNKRMLRATEPDGNWRPSGESLEQCIALGQKYRAMMGF